MTFEEALSIVREKHPNDCISFGYVFDNNFFFNIRHGKEYKKDVLVDSYNCIVDGISGDIRYEFYPFFEEKKTKNSSRNQNNRIHAIINNSIRIDCPEKDWEVIKYNHEMIQLAIG